MKKTSAASCKKIYFSFVLLALAFITAQVSAQTTEPKRIIVLSRYSESVKAAESQFEKKYGAGLRLGVAYQLPDGSIVYVPEEGKTTGEPQR